MCYGVWLRAAFQLLLSCSVVSDPSRPHGLQHARLPCPSPSPGVCSNSCPLSWLCHPTVSSRHSLLLLPSIFPSIRVFSNDSVLLIRWPKYWSFSFSISPSNEYPGLISFRIDWIDLLVVQGTLKSLLQNHSLKASIFMFRDLFNNDNKKEFWSTAFLKANSQRRRFTFGRGCFHLDPFGTKH